MTNGVYVLATLGESPTVLTELLWWVLVEQRRTLAGLEVWATVQGRQLLADLVNGPLWTELQRQTGTLPTLLPFSMAPDATHGFRAHVFGGEANPLRDVRTEREATLVSGELHDRLRELRRTLPARTPILGSLAGGRKTVSAALQTAFSLQAGPSDRLVHVLQDERLEQALLEGGLRGRFAFPSERWVTETGIPLAEQVTVYDVAFPRLRCLVPRRLTTVLDEPWTRVWPVLDANLDRAVHAHLRRTGIQSWSFSIVDANTGAILVKPKKLGTRNGAVFAAMAALHDEDPSAADLVRWLAENPVGWVANGRTARDREQAVRSAATSLRTALQDVPVGLERFLPAEQGFGLQGVTVDLDFERHYIE